MTRDAAHRLVPWDEHRWAGSLRDDVLRVLGDDLGTLLGTTRVAVYPAEPRFPVGFRVLLGVLEFEGLPGRAVTLRARWTVVDGASGSALAVVQSRVEQPVASASFDALVAAQSAALGSVTREIAAKDRAARCEVAPDLLARRRLVARRSPRQERRQDRVEAAPPATGRRPPCRLRSRHRRDRW